MSNPLADIAATLDDYDPAHLRVATAQAFLQRLVEPLVLREAAPRPLADALGGVLAEDVISPLSVPPHDNAAMDGFAFDGAALAGQAAGQALSLRVVGTALAGAAWAGRAGPGEAVKIMTGAVMPAGLDTVVPSELCHCDGERLQVPAGAVQRGDHRRLAGEDLRAGQPALRAGDRLGPAALGLLASLGLAQAPVLRRLRVAYFSTGDELLSPGQAPREGAIFDSNRYTLGSLLRRLGCELLDLGHVPDDPVALQAVLRRAAQQADAVLTSGGAGAGEADHTRSAMQAAGDVAFWRLAMRPGRPLTVGLLPALVDGDHRRLLIGLPGNPVAAMVGFLVFVRPALLRLMGCHAPAAAAPPLLRGRCLQPIRKRPGRAEYQRAVVQTVPGALPEVRITGHQGSGVLSSMQLANGLLVLGHEQGDVAAGDEVDVMLFDGVI